MQFPHDDFGDRYVIERELGHGATATVYLARDLKFDDKLVAIKVLSEHFALPVPRERFLREIQTTAKLNHPHIVTLLEAGITRGGQHRPFYVMRFIDGETLRDVLARGPLANDVALRIARQVAGALGHAHRHGVIHRDIKPGNIMIEDGHTWVTDFGIARAMAATDGQTVTSTGVTIGTPAYMSPEQAMGRGDLDARSDIYSLGCVLYEMLAGRMPFEGPDIQVVLHKHLVEPLPPIRELRADVPERVEQLLDVALAKKREDRFATAVEFAEALSLEGAGALTPTRTQPIPGERRKGIRWKTRTAVAAAATFVVGVLVVAAWALTRPTLRRDRFLVTPDWEYGEGVSRSMNAGRLLQDQLNQWNGITVMGSLDSAATGRPGAAAREVEAAWYIRGGVSRVADSLRVRAQLYGTRGDSLVRERSVNVSPSLAGGDAAFERLADQLLFDDTVWTANGARAGTRSVSARHAFAHGLHAVQEWSLSVADSAFREATERDPSYANAHVWLAQTRFWTAAPAGAWSSSATRAEAGRVHLSARDQTLVDALVASNRGDALRACDAWNRLARAHAYDFAAWYGLGTCLNRDRVVVRDRTSQSGWRFRSSYARALTAYRRAFQLLPSVHYSLRDNAFRAVRDLLLTGPNDLLQGYALAPDTSRFLGRASWQGDSLVVVPFPARWVWDGDSRATPLRAAAAVRHQREFFHDLTTTWVTAFPTSAEAFGALAVALELLNDPAALDTLRRARSLAVDSDERLRIAGAEVWMQLKFALPADLQGVRAAQGLADSLLEVYPASTGPDPFLFASIAVLTGRAPLAAQLARRAALSGQWTLPAPIARSASALMVFAGLGGPADSLEALESQVRAGINALDEQQRQQARLEWLARPATLAFPDHRLPVIRELAGQGYDLVDAQMALLAGDTASVRRILDIAAPARLSNAAEDRTLDVLFPEASLRAAIGDVRGAVAWLDPTLSALAKTPPQSLGDPARAGCLIRAMALRARLAAALGDSQAVKLWSRPLRILRPSRDSVGPVASPR
jgi:tRNA A-37 threonylcarbamoyl transferase component Bud32